jgi:phage FluMu gp28-like protein
VKKPHLSPTLSPPADGAEREKTPTYFLPYQAAWIRDPARLKIVEKSRQIGFTYCDSYDSVRKASAKDGKNVWVMSKDEVAAKEYILYAKRWTNIFKLAAQDLGEQTLSTEKGDSVKVQIIEFASGARIYALSSNPDAIVGKTGHVKLDEFAIHKDQRQLYRIAKPVIQWGGTLSIISTHRGRATVFNDFIRGIKEDGNPMGWSLHSVPVQKAVEEGLVEKINAASGGSESRDAWLARQRAECMDEEQWLQEYCCVPADDGAAFISFEMISSCEDSTARKDFNYLLDAKNPLHIGVDVGRKKDLTVIDVEEKVGDVFWERLRIELQGKTFAEQEYELYRLLSLPQVKRCCIDATGLGMQLAERANERFGYKVESVMFTGPVKEELAFPLRAAHEDRTIRYAPDAKLRADLRGIKKETTASNNIRFVGESEDSHCDRFWAKALALHAGKKVGGLFAIVG